MKLAVALASLLLLLSATLAAAQSIDQYSIEKMAESYNANFENIPLPLKLFLGDERLNIKIAADDGSHSTIGVVSKGGKIESIKSGGIENPTSEVELTPGVLEKIQKSENLFAGASEVIESGELKLSGKNPITSLKFFLVGLLLKILSFLNLGPSGAVITTIIG